MPRLDDPSDKDDENDDESSGDESDGDDTPDLWDVITDWSVW